MSAVLPLVIILVMVAFNALYVAAEFATVGARRSRVQEQAERGDKSARALFEILRAPERLDNYVASCQIGITLSSLVAGAYGQAQLTPVFEDWFGSAAPVVSIVVVLILVTSLQVVLGELLPKTAALRYPERLAMATLPPMRISQVLFRPLVTIFNGSAFTLMRWWGLKSDHGHAHVHSPEELVDLYGESAAGGLIDMSERDMLAGVLNVEHRMVREIMTPRRRLVTVRDELTVAAALAAVVESPHSRFPVEAGDDIVGVVHLRDLYLTAAERPDAGVDEIMRPVVAVAETLSVPKLWTRLGEENRHVAFIVNEFGSIIGMVTLEDAIEEIVGEVRDEFDEEREPIVVHEGRVIVRGDVLDDTIADRFGVDVTIPDIDTVGGLVWHALGRLPEVGDVAVLEPAGLEVRVDEMEGREVRWVSFDVPEEPS